MPKRNATRKGLRLTACLYLTFGRFFIKKPSKLLWTVSDFKTGRKWAMTVPHPYLRNKSLWDYVSTEKDSALILHKLNQYI
jgi:hypothetical protein